MGGRLSLQRTARPLVPANFRDGQRTVATLHTVTPRTSSGGGLGAAYAKITFLLKALARPPGSREILRKSRPGK
jgi:hypothetical protein